MIRFGSLVLLALCLSACPEDQTLVMTFDDEPAKSNQVAPSGETVNFDRPPTHKASVEQLPPPRTIDTKQLPQIKRETVADPHANIPDYKERGEANRRALAEQQQAARLEGDPRTLFFNHCASCHSYDGTGHIKHPLAKIPDLSSALVQSKIKDETIYKAIAEGHAGTTPFASLMNGEQINGIVALVRQLVR